MSKAQYPHVFADLTSPQFRAMHQHLSYTNSVQLQLFNPSR